MRERERERERVCAAVTKSLPRETFVDVTFRKKKKISETRVPKISENSGPMKHFSVNNRTLLGGALTFVWLANSQAFNLSKA